MSLALEIADLFISENQASKYVTHNRAILLLAVMGGGVISRTTATPPGSPVNGDAYLIPADATGVWLAHIDQITMYYNGWLYFEPIAGPIVAVQDEGLFLTYSGTWDVLDIGGGIGSFTQLSDVPGSYTGQGGKGVRVNAGATALEFYDILSPGSAFTYIDDNSGARTLALTDISTGAVPKIIRAQHATANAITVPTNSAVAVPVGSQFNILHDGAGTLSIVQGSGVTVRVPPNGTLNSMGIGSMLLLIKRATDTWQLVGGVAAA